MFPRFVAALLFVVVPVAPGFVQTALAQDEAVAQPLAVSVAATSTSQFADADQSATQLPRDIRRSGISWTTPVLASLQATTMVTQMLDVHSTLRALEVGAVEANPMMGGLVKNRAAFIGVKAAMGAGLMYATHRLSKNNKVGAIVMATVVNSAYIFVARHNYRVARSLQ